MLPDLEADVNPEAEVRQWPCQVSPSPCTLQSGFRVCSWDEHPVKFLYHPQPLKICFLRPISKQQDKVKAERTVTFPNWYLLSLLEVMSPPLLWESWGRMKHMGFNPLIVDETCFVHNGC